MGKRISKQLFSSLMLAAGLTPKEESWEKTSQTSGDRWHGYSTSSTYYLESEEGITIEGDRDKDYLDININYPDKKSFKIAIHIKSMLIKKGFNDKDIRQTLDVDHKFFRKIMNFLEDDSRLDNHDLQELGKFLEKFGFKEEFNV